MPENGLPIFLRRHYPDQVLGYNLSNHGIIHEAPLTGGKSINNFSCLRFLLSTYLQL